MEDLGGGGGLTGVKWKTDENSKKRRIMISFKKQEMTCYYCLNRNAELM